MFRGLNPSLRAEASGIESVEAVFRSGTPANAVTNYVGDKDVDLVDG
jgi:hypothetical protein